jgi:hypothetical protein
MTFVSQHANNLCRQCLIQQLYNSFAVGAVALSHSSILDVLPGTFAQSFDVSEKWLISHSPHSLILNLGEQRY